MEEKQISEFSEKIVEGLRLARKRLLHERALHGETVVIADEEGRVVHVPAAEIIANHPEYQ